MNVRSNSSRLDSGLDENHYVEKERDLYLYEFKQRFHQLFNKHIPNSHKLEKIPAIERDCSNETTRIKGSFILNFLIIKILKQIQLKMRAKKPKCRC